MQFFFGFLIIAAILLFIKRYSLMCFAAKIMYIKNNIEGAEKLFKKAFKKSTPAPEYQLLYGYILLRKGKLENARKVLNMASMAKTKPQVALKIKAMRALVFWKDGDIDTAIEMLEEVDAKFKNTAVYQDLGLLYVLKGDKEKALKYNLEAYEYNSDDNVITDNLAEAYTLSGENEKAEEIYKTLLERNPRFAEAYWGFGLLLINTGRKEEGLKLMKQSLEKRVTFLSILQKDEIKDLIKKYETE